MRSVRLACVRRAASVRPEPGSNSLVMVFKERPNRSLASRQITLYTKCSIPCMHSDAMRLELLLKEFISHPIYMYIHGNAGCTLLCNRVSSSALLPNLDTARRKTARLHMA